MNLPEKNPLAGRSAGRWTPEDQDTSEARHPRLSPGVAMPTKPVLEAKLSLRVEEAAVLLGISRGLAYELVNRGEIPALRLGRRIVVPRATLEAFVAAGEAFHGRCRAG